MYFETELLGVVRNQNQGYVSVFPDKSFTVAQTCSMKKVFLEIFQNSQENTCARVSILIKLQGSALQLY